MSSEPFRLRASRQSCARLLLKRVGHEANGRNRIARILGQMRRLARARRLQLRARSQRRPKKARTARRTTTNPMIVSTLYIVLRHCLVPKARSFLREPGSAQYFDSLRVFPERPLSLLAGLAGLLLSSMRYRRPKPDLRNREGHPYECSDCATSPSTSIGIDHIGLR